MKQRDETLENFLSERYDDLEIEMDGVDQLWDRIDRQPKPDRKFPFWLLGMAGILVFGAWFFLTYQDSVNSVSDKSIAQVMEYNEDKSSEEAERQSKIEGVIPKEKALPADIPKFVQKGISQTKAAETSTPDEKRALSIADTESKTSYARTEEQGGTKMDEPTNYHFNLNLGSASASEMTKLEELDGLPLIVFEPTSDSQQRIVFEELDATQVEPLTKFQRSFYLRPSFQVFKPYDRIKTIDSEDRIGGELRSEVYKDLHKQYFNPLVVVGTRVEALCNFRKKMGVSFGIEFSLLESQFESNQIDYERVFEYNPTAFILRESGEWIGENGYGQQRVRTTTFESVKELSLNVPIGLYYSMYEDNAFRASLMTEVIFNIHRKHRGYFIDESLQLQKNDPAYSQRNFLSRTEYAAGLAIEYDLNDHFSVSFQPRLRYSPDLGTTSLVKHTRFQIGSSFGIQMRMGE